MLEFLEEQTYNSYGNQDNYYDIYFSDLSPDDSLLDYMFETIEGEVINCIYEFNLRRMKEKSGKTIINRFKEQLSKGIPVKRAAESIASDFDIGTIYNQSMFRFAVDRQRKTLNAY